jgi:hypothetical protein
MVDLIEGEILARLGRERSATVAMHAHEGMIREGHIVNVLVSPGTVSRAFDFDNTHTLVEDDVVVQYRQRSSGFIQIVEVDSLAIDTTNVRSLRYSVNRRADDAEHRLLIDTQIFQDPAPDPPPPRDDAEVMAEMARAVAAATPAVAVERPQVPELGDEPVENLRRLFDLTYADIGRLFGISERHAYRWQREGVPKDSRSAVDALQAIGLTIIGGLGPAGAKAWLNSGSPPGVELVQTGAIAQLARRAEADKESPYT